MRKKYLILGIAVLAISMTACGKKNTNKLKNTRIDNETEATTETASDTTSQATTSVVTTNKESTTIAVTKAQPVKQAAPVKTVKSAEIGKTVNDAEPNADAASPITGVSNAIFLDVSSTVREQASNSYRETLRSYFKEDSKNEAQDIKDIAATLNEWKAKYKDANDKTYAEIGSDLLTAYSRLAALDNIIIANQDKLTDKELADHDRIAFDLQGNVEIFLNTNNVTALTNEEDFACLNRINTLRADIENQLKAPVTEVTTEAVTQ